MEKKRSGVGADTATRAGRDGNRSNGAASPNSEATRGDFLTFGLAAAGALNAAVSASASTTRAARRAPNSDHIVDAPVVRAPGSL